MHRVILVVSLLSGCATVPTQRDLESADIHHDLGVNAMTRGNAQDALREFQEAVKSNPNMPEAHNALGLLYHWSYRKFDDAKVEFEKALALRPAYPEAWNNLGALRADMGDVAGAKDAFERALGDPFYKTPWVAQTNLGWALHLGGQTDQGEGLVRAALQTLPKYCVGHRNLARILEARGKQADADASWEAYAKYCPDEPEALLKFAAVQARRGEQREASMALVRCLDRAGSKPVAVDCREALAQLPPLSPEDLAAVHEDVKHGPVAPLPSVLEAGRSVEGSRDLEAKPDAKKPE